MKYECVCVCLTVDGGWSEWTMWSECTSECERQRTRECTDPEPKHGGRLCDGAALDTDNCTGDLCIQGGQSSISLLSLLLLFSTLFLADVWVQSLRN